MAWLAEKGRGFEARGTKVPIVPTAVVFDLRPGRRRPDAATGRAACEAASGRPVAEGLEGAGTGATVGKVAGTGMPGGVGSWALDSGPYRVGALAILNALGDVLDGGGRIVAGAQKPDGTFVDATRVLRTDPAGALARVEAATNTTLAVVATDAPLSRPDLTRVARIAANAFARRISPVHTPFDGDVMFMLSTVERESAVPALGLLALGVAAQHALEEAITRAVSEGSR
jgi:L-aminopeptidase/D-esterase-like protein